MEITIKHLLFTGLVANFLIIGNLFIELLLKARYYGCFKALNLDDAKRRLPKHTLSEYKRDIRFFVIVAACLTALIFMV